MRRAALVAALAITASPGLTEPILGEIPILVGTIVLLTAELQVPSASAEK